jgi:hypothetical protein
LFENRVLRRIFGLKRDAVTGGWSEQHTEELHNLHSSPSIITMVKLRRIGWIRHVARMVEKRNLYGILVEKSEEWRPLGRRTRWEDNIKMDLENIEWGDLDMFWLRLGTSGGLL